MIYLTDFFFRIQSLFHRRPIWKKDIIDNRSHFAPDFKEHNLQQIAYYDNELDKEFTTEISIIIS